jgi:hypothetical protein
MAEVEACLEALISRFRPLSMPQSSLEPTSPHGQHVHSMNLHRDYADHKPSSLQEHLQNWRDGGLSLAGKLDPAATMVTYSQESGSCRLYMTNAIIGGCSEVTVGWLMTTPDQVIFMNADTVLSLDMLLLGKSSKRGDAGPIKGKYFAGHFGEGVKVGGEQLKQYCCILSSLLTA